jgi:hypothetical protein
MKLCRRRKGVSQVITSIMLTATVFTIGASVWFYTSGASSAMTKDYYDGVITLLEEVTERFEIIHVYLTNNDTLHLYVLNYGSTNITVDAYAYVDNNTYSSDTGNPVYISVGAYEYLNVTLAVTSGEEIAIKIHSRRQNNAYGTYIAQ